MNATKTIPAPMVAISGRAALLLEKTWLRLTLLITAAFLIHLPALQGQLIWDDSYLIKENPFFRSPIFSLEVFRHYLFLDSSSGHYRPVQNLSYMLDYMVWNGNLYGYHLSNILWHAASGVLLFLLLRRLLAPWIAATTLNRSVAATAAWLVALIWTLHPVQSAAVDYISGRADSLTFFFSSASWLLYLRAADEKRPRRRAAGYIAASILFLLALCSREIALMWAILFAVDLFWFGKARPARHRLLAVMVCALVITTYAALRSLPERRPAPPSPAASWSAVARGGLMLRALGDYAGLTVWPRNLHMERTLVVNQMFKSKAWRDQFAFRAVSALGILVGALLVLGAAKRGSGRPVRIFGTLWFVASFLPISNIVDLNATSAEHWLYLPLVGLLLVGLGWILDLPPRGRRLAAICTLFFAAALGVRSTIRSSDWLNAQVFYERTIAAGGWSPRVALNLAVIYGGQNRLAEARQLLERTLANWPDYPQAQSCLAVILRQQGAIELSNRMLVRATRPSPAQKEYPRSWVATLHSAQSKLESKQTEEALRVLEEARRAEPKVWPLVRLQAEILQNEGRLSAAFALVQGFADRHWWQHPAFLALGKLKAQQGDRPGALAALRHACRLDIRETEALNLITRIEMRAENFPAALAAQERAVSRQPDEPSQYILYSEVLMQMGRTEQARHAVETAKSLQQLGRTSA